MMRPQKYEKGSPHVCESDMVHLAMPRETIFGVGCLRSVGEAAARLGTRAFLVTAPESAQAKGVVDRVYGELVKHGMNPIAAPMPELYPDIAVVDSAAETCAENKCDVIVGVGEIDVTDAAKLVSILRGSGTGSIRPFLVDERRIEAPPLHLMSIPSPTITGAEFGAVAFVVDKKSGLGHTLCHPYLMPETVVIDPELSVSVPRALTAVAGIGAFAHSLEALVSLRANELTDTLAAEALRLIGHNLVRAVTDATDMDAKTALCVAAYLAGAAANGAGLGVASLLARPLGMSLATGYGEALALVLPASIEFNFDHARDKYERVPGLLETETELSVRRFTDVFAALYDAAGINSIVTEYRMDYGKIEETLCAVERSDVHAATNPRPVDRAGLVRILRRTREYIHQ